MFPCLETREGRQKIWEGISEFQPKNVFLTHDADSMVRTAQNKQSLPQLFRVHLAVRVKFSASAVALMGFGRLSVGYHYKCSFSGFFHRLLNLLGFGTLGECRPVPYNSSRKKWSFTILTFLDFEDEIPQN